jgi:hypothetical protein
VKARLEEVLKEKERELKLYRRFLDLRSYCDKKVFPLIDAPIAAHVETLKGIIEKLIPDPKDRTEEMFSGEIFALLGTIYLHDLSLMREFDWPLNGDILNARDMDVKGVFMNYEIARRLDIPEGAVEAINALSYAHLVKKVPLETEITDNASKAIIRNMKVFEYLFNFAHLLVDVFFTDLAHNRLKRYGDHELALRPGEAVLDVDSREGIISIQYNSRVPYETHMLESVKRYVESMFVRFKNHVNGKLGFQYREIVWVITSNFYYERDVFRIPKVSPYFEFEGVPVQRWDEASVVLDRLFNERSVVVAGEVSAGKTTLLTYFVLPQLTTVHENVYYCELWSQPTKELRDVIGKRHKIPRVDDLDITSLCKTLLKGGPCFFVIDGLERIVFMEQWEREKLVRFVEFMLGEPGAYFVLCGEKETFFDWYRVFQGMQISSLYELKAFERASYGRTPGNPRRISGDVHGLPLGEGFPKGPAETDAFVRGALQGINDDGDLALVLSVFVDAAGPVMKRYDVDDIHNETAIPHERIMPLVSSLGERGILRETEYQGSPYFALANRVLREPLWRALDLGRFEEKKMLRTILGNLIVNETFLDDETLGLAERWQNQLVMSKEEMGITLASLIARGRDWRGLFETANRSERGIDIQPILKLLYSEDVEKRRNAISLLVEINDKDMINPLLLHLKEEDVLEIKNLVIQGIGQTGKKRAIIAIMNTLKEIGDRGLKLRALDFLQSLFGDNSSSILTEIKEIEEDPVITKRIDELLRA